MRGMFALAIAACAVALGAAQAVTDPYEVVTVTLPAGNAKAGRQAFEDLKCYVCHQKTGEARFPAPVGAARGPDLDATLRRQSASEVAAAIVAPSHSMSVRTPQALRPSLARESASPMGDFSATLTVRQLADLLAYLGNSASLVPDWRSCSGGAHPGLSVGRPNLPSVPISEIRQRPALEDRFGEVILDAPQRLASVTDNRRPGISMYSLLVRAISCSSRSSMTIIGESSDRTIPTTRCRPPIASSCCRATRRRARTRRSCFGSSIRTIACCPLRYAVPQR